MPVSKTVPAPVTTPDVSQLSIVEKQPANSHEIETSLAFRSEQSNWISAMYTELLNDVIGIIPDDDVCKLLGLYEDSLAIIAAAQIDHSKLRNN